MERHAILEAKYGEALRKLAEAKALLEPVSDSEIPGLSNRLTTVCRALDDVQSEVSSICNEVGRMAVRGR